MMLKYKINNVFLQILNVIIITLIISLVLTLNYSVYINNIVNVEIEYVDTF